MQYLHAALVLHSSGKGVSEKGITAIIKAAGDKPDEAKIKALVSTLESLDIDEAIKGASFMTAASPGTTGAADTGKETVASTTEPEEEEEEAGDDLGLSSLFG
ncbi:50S ribosomal protein P1 [Candidatus Heimdallarchaeota archaeon B3_Heim]|nr:MAG: 50S ribosomal protein P1 [Candidatus Heimdallarchaeota archaeon B3_Heim]